jgi:nitrogen fixation protein NifB
VTTITLLVDAVKQEVADKLYAWIRPGRKTISLKQAIPMLIKEQLHAVKAFKKEGCKVIARTTVYPGFNDKHVEEISRAMAEAGADKMLVVPCCKTSGEQGEPLLSPPGPETMQLLQKSASKHLETLLIEETEKSIGVDCSSLHGACKSIATLQPKPTKSQPNVAVVSSNGMEVDLHLGQAYKVLIYGPREDGLACLLGTRPVPEPGSGGSRWEELAGSLHDCFAVLAVSAGESPRRILASYGITVLITENDIEGIVDVLYGGGKKKRSKRS